MDDQWCPLFLKRSDDITYPGAVLHIDNETNEQLMGFDGIVIRNVLMCISTVAMNTVLMYYVLSDTINSSFHSSIVSLFVSYQLDRIKLNFIAFHAKLLCFTVLGDWSLWNQSLTESILPVPRIRNYAPTQSHCFISLSLSLSASCLYTLFFSQFSSWCIILPTGFIKSIVSSPKWPRRHLAVLVSASFILFFSVFFITNLNSFQNKTHFCLRDSLIR